jgi:hypothetical protein
MGKTEAVSRLPREEKLQFLQKALRPVPREVAGPVKAGEPWMIGEFEDADLEPKFFVIHANTILKLFPLSVHTVYLASNPVGADGKPDYSLYLLESDISREDFDHVYPGRAERLLMTGRLIGVAGVVGAAVVIALITMFRRHR